MISSRSFCKPVPPVAAISSMRSSTRSAPIAQHS
jgi:hypothetical protein